MRFGYVAVFDNPEMGLVFNPASITGINFWYQPTRAVISNPALKKSLELEIGKDCELLKLTPDYFGIFDIINLHAEKLALLEKLKNEEIPIVMWNNKNKQEEKSYVYNINDKITKTREILSSK